VTARTVIAKRRARVAQLCLGGAAVLVFGGSLAAVRAHAVGHAKRPVRPLSAPAGFVRVVRRDALAAGAIAPAQAPPQTATSQS
jgi:hypothetical protein